MERIDIDPDNLTINSELSRMSRSKVFEERLRASIEQIGLAEPIKVARTPGGPYVVIDGALRVKAVLAIREDEPSRFKTIPAYVMDYGKRFEIRFQSDIYQDLLPSQMAIFVEHLHDQEGVRKADIASYIGVSPATLRNYTGLWRLLQRGGLFARVVNLMDLGVLPASNPYAWLRLTARGVERVLTDSFAGGEDLDSWLEAVISDARSGSVVRFSLTYVQSATDSLPPECYREREETRAVKRDLGLRRASPQKATLEDRPAVNRLRRVSSQSPSAVLRSAAAALERYLQ